MYVCVALLTPSRCGGAGTCSLGAGQVDDALIWLGKKVALLRTCHGADSPFFLKEERALKELYAQLGRDSSGLLERRPLAGSDDED